MVHYATRKTLFLRAFLYLMLIWTATAKAGTESVWLSWDVAPWDENIVQYRVFYGTESGVYTNTLDSYYWDGAVISDLEAGSTNYFAVVGINGDGEMTPMSEELAFVVPKPEPVVLQSEILTDWTGQAYGIYAYGSWNLPTYWEMQYSTDLVNWSVWMDGYGNSCWAYVGFEGWDNFYFRLAQY